MNVTLCHLINPICNRFLGYDYKARQIYKANKQTNNMIKIIGRRKQGNKIRTITTINEK